MYITPKIMDAWKSGILVSIQSVSAHFKTKGFLKGKLYDFAYFSEEIQGNSFSFLFFH